MDKEDIRFEAYKKWQAKEQEYEEFERQHRKDLARLEEQQDILNDRRGRLQLLAEEEIYKLEGFLKMQSAPLDFEPAARFFRDVTFFLEDADHAYAQASGRLQEEEDDLVRAFRKKRSVYEEEIDNLRRAYGNTYE